MNALEFRRRTPRARCGLKGPRAAAWLESLGIAPPSSPNTWTTSPASAAAGAPGATPDDALLVARLGSSEFFLEDGVGLTELRRVEPLGRIEHDPAAHPPGVYPVLRADAAFLLSGQGSLDVLAQVCNVNFGDLALDSRPLIMTLMIGVAVLVVPQVWGAECRYRIWCDPTFGHFMGESIGMVVRESGGNYLGEQG